MATIQVIYMGENEHLYGRAWWDGDGVGYEGGDERDIKAMEGLLKITQEKLMGASEKEALPRIPEFFKGIVWASAKMEPVKDGE